MSKLKAARSILYLNRIYEAGDELPCHDEATVEAWVEAKSAFWEGKESDCVKAVEPAGTTPGADTATGAEEVKKASRSASAARKKAISK